MTVTISMQHGTAVRQQSSTVFHGLFSVLLPLYSAKRSETDQGEHFLLSGKCRIIASALDELGIYYTGGKNSPYIWLKCPNNMGSWEFFDLLLNEANVVGTPGEGFGENGAGYFRLTSFGDRENTIEAVERIKKVLTNLSK